MPGQSKPSAADFVEVETGAVASIRLSPSAKGDYDQAVDGKDKISLQRKTHLARYFAEFCASLRPRLNDEKFKKEGNFSDGNGGTVAIFTFKAWQWRLYGSILTVAGKRCFVGTRVDAFKKQNKADKKMLERTAEDISQLREYGEK